MCNFTLDLHHMDKNKILAIFNKKCKNF